MCRTMFLLPDLTDLLRLSTIRLALLLPALTLKKAVHRAFSVFDAFFRGDPVSMTYIIDFKVIFGASSDCRLDLDSFKKQHDSIAV